MRVLELFSGSGSIKTACNQLGVYCFSIDNNPDARADLYIDLLAWDPASLHFSPYVVWASPPCQSWSFASSRHRTLSSMRAKTPEAVLGEALVLRTLEIIKQLKPRYWFIENPRGRLRADDVATLGELHGELGGVAEGSGGALLRDVDVLARDGYFCFHVLQAPQISAPPLVASLSSEPVAVFALGDDFVSLDTDRPWMVLHIGPPKTGTTTIQKGLMLNSRLLAGYDNVFYLGQSGIVTKHGAKTEYVRYTDHRTNKKAKLRIYQDRP